MRVLAASALAEKDKRQAARQKAEQSRSGVSGVMRLKEGGGAGRGRGTCQQRLVGCVEPWSMETLLSACMLSDRRRVKHPGADTETYGDDDGGPVNGSGSLKRTSTVFMYRSMRSVANTLMSAVNADWREERVPGGGKHTEGGIEGGRGQGEVARSAAVAVSAEELQAGVHGLVKRLEGSFDLNFELEQDAAHFQTLVNQLLKNKSQRYVAFLRVCVYEFVHCVLVQSLGN